jgi:hypothetical protein
MEWLRRKLLNWLNKEERESPPRLNLSALSSTSSSKASVSEIYAKTSIRFTVYPANGGHVVEHVKYDRDRDTEGPSLTIVHHGEEIGKTVEHIIAIESLRS